LVYEDIWFSCKIRKDIDLNANNAKNFKIKSRFFEIKNENLKDNSCEKNDENYINYYSQNTNNKFYYDKKLEDKTQSSDEANIDFNPRRNINQKGKLPNSLKSNALISNLQMKNIFMIESIKNKNYVLYEQLVYLYQVIKYNEPHFHLSLRRFKVLFLKENYFNFNTANFPKNVNHQIKELIEDDENEILKNSFSLRIKFVENEMILFKIDQIKDKIQLNKNSNYIYFYRINDIIFDPLPEKDFCKIKLNFLSKSKNCYLYGFTVYGRRYKILFKIYEDLITFYNYAKKLSYQFNNTFSLIYKNKLRSFDLIENTINFGKCNKKFNYVHKIFDNSSNMKFNIRSFNKKFIINEQIKTFLSNLFLLCRLNNFFEINVFPIVDIYENNSFFIIKYSLDEYKIGFDLPNSTFLVSVKNFELAQILLDQIKKFTKLVKILNIKPQVDELLELFNSSKK